MVPKCLEITVKVKAYSHRPVQVNLLCDVLHVCPQLLWCLMGSLHASVGDAKGVEKHVYIVKPVTTVQWFTACDLLGTRALITLGFINVILSSLMCVPVWVIPISWRTHVL